MAILTKSGVAGVSPAVHAAKLSAIRVGFNRVPYSHEPLPYPRRSRGGRPLRLREPSSSWGLVAILLGGWRKWRWVRNFWFRLLHFLMIAVVVVESLVGIVCPLTDWEDALREKAGETVEQGTFIGRMVHRSAVRASSARRLDDLAIASSAWSSWRRFSSCRRSGRNGGRGRGRRKGEGGSRC